jgi:hypothetical protein
MTLDERDPTPAYERRVDVPGGSPEPLPGRCGRKRSQGPGYCMKLPVKGRTACYKHGGHAQVGALSPNYKHGGYSQYMQLELAQRFLATRTDPELLSLQNDVTLVTERINGLLERCTSGESGAAWRQLAKHWKEFQRYRASGNVPKMEEALGLMAEPLTQGIADHAAWEELGLQLDRRARLVDQEQRRLEKLQATLTVEQALGLLGTVLDVLKRHVLDPDILAAIGADLEQLVALDAVPFAARSRRSRR